MTRRLLAVLCLAALAASACGKRGDLEQPEGSSYPRTYPAPETVVPEDDTDAAGGST